jgi:hypothetical protein
MIKPGNSSASSLLSKIKNAMEAIKSWFENKDRKDALELLNSESSGKEIQEEATQLSERVSDIAIGSSYDKIDECFKWYQNVLGSDEFYPGEIDIAAKELITCIGKELTRLNAVNGNAGEGVVKKYWTMHGRQE